MSLASLSDTYRERIIALQNDPEQVEQLYQTARRARRAGQFAQDMNALFQESSENVLYAAWHYRLQQSAPAEDWLAARERPLAAGDCDECAAGLDLVGPICSGP